MAELAPESKEDSSVPSAQGAVFELQEIVRRHHRLLSVYVYILDLISRPGSLPAGIEPSERDPKKEARTHRPEEPARTSGIRPIRYQRRLFTRILVESHIKAKLGELKTAYAEIEQLIPQDSPATSREWFKETQDSLSRLSDRLTSWASIRGLAATLWPVLVGPVLAWLGADSIWDAIWDLADKKKPQLSAVGVSATWILFPLAYILLFAGGAAGVKRGVFLAEISTNTTWDGHTQAIVAKNVYEAEDELFNYIAKGKLPEIPVDSYVMASWFLTFGAYAVGVGVFIADGRPVLRYSNYGAAIVILYIGIKEIIKGRRRTPN